MTRENVARIEIVRVQKSRKVRIDPDIGGGEQSVVLGAPSRTFKIDSDALLAEIADDEVETRPVMKRWQLTRAAAARRFDADNLGAEVS